LVIWVNRASVSSSRIYLSETLPGEQQIARTGFSPAGKPRHRGTLTDSAKI